MKKRKAMPKIMQNLVVLMEPSRYASRISLKGGNMCYNRFCIDEDAAFETSGVHYLKKFRYLGDESKGKGYKRLTINDISVKNNLKLHKKSNLMSTSLILHSKKFLITNPKILKSTLFMLAIIIMSTND